MRTQCYNNIRQQTTAQFSFATDFNGKYAPNQDWAPYYAKSQFSVKDNNIFDLMQGSYVTDPNIMVCPLIAELPSGSEPFFYQPTSTINAIPNSIYGNWFDYPYPFKTNIASAYNWWANFVPSTGNPDHLVLVGDTKPFPTGIEESDSDRVMVNHRMAPKRDMSHGGRGHDNSVTGVDDFESYENPIGYGDGSVDINTIGDQFQLRVKITAGAATDFYW